MPLCSIALICLVIWLVSYMLFLKVETFWYFCFRVRPVLPRWHDIWKQRKEIVRYRKRQQVDCSTEEKKRELIDWQKRKRTSHGLQPSLLSSSIAGSLLWYVAVDGEWNGRESEGDVWSICIDWMWWPGTRARPRTRNSSCSLGVPMYSLQLPRMRFWSRSVHSSTPTSTRPSVMDTRIDLFSQSLIWCRACSTGAFDSVSPVTNGAGWRSVI